MERTESEEPSSTWSRMDIAPAPRNPPCVDKLLPILTKAGYYIDDAIVEEATEDLNASSWLDGDVRQPQHGGGQTDKTRAVATIRLHGKFTAYLTFASCLMALTRGCFTLGCFTWGCLMALTLGCFTRGIVYL